MANDVMGQLDYSCYSSSKRYTVDSKLDASRGSGY